MNGALASAEIALPRIARVRLSSFDLYTEQPNIDIKIEKNVFCLIGANGLGKTTFLNTLLFGITGAIPDPKRKFVSIQKYVKEASRPDKVADYFEGRISEKNRSIANVSVELVWDSATIRITRPFFRDSEGAVLEIERDNSTERFDGTNTKSDSQITQKYRDCIVELCGLSDYRQFVFLYHFILTFDEGRHLLMWDDTALTDALYLAFGSEPEFAQKAESLRQEMNRADSKARNAKYAAKLAADQISFLRELESDSADEAISGHNNEELSSKYDELQHELSAAEDRLEERRRALKEAELKWTELSSSLTELQVEYQKTFSKFLEGRTSAHYHPLIKTTLSDDKCAVCGTVHVAERIAKALEAKECPLCESALSGENTSKEDPDDLKRVDNAISNVRDSITEVLSRRDRIRSELETAEARFFAARNALSDFEDHIDPRFLARPNNPNGNEFERQVKKLEGERLQHNQASVELYRKRDEYRGELREMEKLLKKKYDAAANIFVPRFRELAEAFIGIEIDITLKQHQSKNKSGFGLWLSMAGEERGRSAMVSESQGFFIDIALRMALSEYLSSGVATLLIDTPEGSLDIAYEARAGAMFGKFTGSDNRIVMTANLRSSELVIRLAEEQGYSQMQIERMTDWTELSAVQKEEERLFIEAFEDINEALGSS